MPVTPAPGRWPACMKVATCAEYLDCSIPEVNRLVREGAFGCVQFSERGDRRINKESIDEWLRSLEHKTVLGRRAAA